MAINTGTYDLSALLEVRNVSAEAFGMDDIARAVQDEVAAHNMNTAGIMSGLVDVTKEVQEVYGTSTDGRMVEVDEYGLGPTQAPRTGAQVAYPMRKFQYNTGWTSDYFKRQTPADVAVVAGDALQAHLSQIRLLVAQAIFGATNYTVTDRFGKGISLSVKRLVNADSDPIKNGPNGETFDAATHSHYNANASLTAAVLKDNLNDVIEHGHASGLQIAINRADLDAVIALTGFKGYNDPRLILGTEADKAPGIKDMTKLDNIAVGLFNGAEVWVRPWVPANYALAYAAGDPRKPLKMRVPTWQAALAPQLSLSASFNQHPLTSEAFESYFGVGAFQRTNAAVLYFAGGAYVVPTIS